MKYKVIRNIPMAEALVMKQVQKKLPCMYST